MLMSSILIKIPIVLYEGTKSKFDSNSSSQQLKITAREFWKLVYVIYFRDKDKLVWRTTVDWYVIEWHMVKYPIEMVKSVNIETKALGLQVFKLLWRNNPILRVL